jgi:hypothetical protein
VRNTGSSYASYEKHIADLASQKCNVIAIEGAPALMLLGPAREAEMADGWKQKYNTEMFTSAQNQVNAFKALKAKRNLGIHLRLRRAGDEQGLCKIFRGQRNRRRRHGGDGRWIQVHPGRATCDDRFLHQEGLRGIQGRGWYGTDQEYVAFQDWKHLLESGDTVLIMLNQSDYFDVLRRRFFGRAKPYFEKVNGSYVLRQPTIGLWERCSDWSRVASIVARLIEPTAPENLDPSQSIEVIRFILGRIREEVPRGARVVLAHQGTHDFLGPKLGLSSTIFCEFADICIDLDDALAADPVHLLPDGHWSTSGHTAVAQVLSKALRD